MAKVCSYCKSKAQFEYERQTKVEKVACEAHLFKLRFLVIEKQGFIRPTQAKVSP